MGNDLNKKYLPEADWVENGADTAAILLSAVAAFFPPLSIPAEWLKKCVAASLENRFREGLNLAGKEVSLLEERIQTLEDVIDASRIFVSAYAQEQNMAKRKYFHQIYKKFIYHKAKDFSATVIDEYETWMKTAVSLSSNSFEFLLLFESIGTRKETSRDYEHEAKKNFGVYMEKYRSELQAQGLISIDADDFYGSVGYYISVSGKEFLRWIENSSQDAPENLN